MLANIIENFLNSFINIILHFSITWFWISNSVIFSFFCFFASHAITGLVMITVGVESTLLEIYPYVHILKEINSVHLGCVCAVVSLGNGMPMLTRCLFVSVNVKIHFFSHSNKSLKNWAYNIFLCVYV